MKALSVRQPWAQMIAQGLKTIEVRSRPWRYRGTLVICATARPIVLDDDGHPLPTGAALAIVDMIDCRPLRPEDAGPACLAGDYGDFSAAEISNRWAWVLCNARMVEPVPVKGQLAPWEWTGPALEMIALNI